MNTPWSASGALLKGLALVELRAGVTPAAARSLRQRGLPVPAAVRLAALIDTGAERTAINVESLALAGVAPCGMVNVRTGADRQRPEPCPEYEVALWLANAGGQTLALGVRRVTGASIAVADALLGLDILHALAFEYDGPAGFYRLRAS